MNQHALKVYSFPAQ